MRRRGTTSAWPAVTGKASAIANADRFAANQSAGGISAKGDEGEVTGSEPEPYAVSVRGHMETVGMTLFLVFDSDEPPNASTDPRRQGLIHRRQALNAPVVGSHAASRVVCHAR